MMCVHKSSQMQTYKEKQNTDKITCHTQKKKTSHTLLFYVCRVIQQESTAFDAVALLLSVIPSTALRWTQTLLRLTQTAPRSHWGSGASPVPHIFLNASN